MKKIIFIFFILTLLNSFSLIASADEYDRDEALSAWKLAAYALYPAGYIFENVVVKPAHWLISLPYLKEISGHEELSKSLSADEKTKENEADTENLVH
jgi:hypothetical protein